LTSTRQLGLLAAPASTNCNDVVLSLVDFTGNLELVFIGINATKRFDPAGQKYVSLDDVNETNGNNPPKHTIKCKA